MAARKSCTHLTWSQAKAKAGEGSGKQKKSDGSIVKKLTHVEKIIAKTGPSTKDQKQHKIAMRKQHRQEERASIAAKRREEERQRQKEEESVMKPYEEALKKINELALSTTSLTQMEDNSTGGDILPHEESIIHIVHCKEMQLDELIALEAMYAEEDTFRLCESSKLDQLREKVEEWQIDQDNQTLMLAIAKHVPISFTLKLRIERCCEENDSFLALMLLQISLPPKYPLHGSAPDFHIVWFIVVDPLETCNANKPLETLGYCDELKLKDTIKREAEGQLLPDPCVYELATTWLSEHLKEYVTLSPHARK